MDATAAEELKRVKKILVIIVIALIVGALMGFRAGQHFWWSRALIAGLAFGILGWLVTFIRARRRQG